MKIYNKPTMRVIEVKCTCLNSVSNSGPFSGSNVNTPGVGSRSGSYDEEYDDF